MEYLFVLGSALFSTAALFFIARFLGYRQIAELTVFDYVNSITIGSIAAELASSQSWGEAARYSIAMGVYALFTCVISLLDNHSARFRRYLTGETAVLMRGGRLMEENFRRAKMDLNEFLMQCRNAGQFDLAKLDTVYLEPNGRISILPLSTDRPATPADLGIRPEQEQIPVPVVMDGKTLSDNLRALGFNEKWLSERLREHGAEAKMTFLATATQGGAFYCSVGRAGK